MIQRFVSTLTGVVVSIVLLNLGATAAPRTAPPVAECFACGICFQGGQATLCCPSRPFGALACIIGGDPPSCVTVGQCP